MIHKRERKSKLNNHDCKDARATHLLNHAVSHLRDESQTIYRVKVLVATIPINKKINSK